MTQTYKASYFPLDTIGATSHDTELPDGSNSSAFVGLCFSGGGSRALSAAMGQLRALRSLGLLDKTLFISAVSGGAWATSLFTCLPKSISDDHFLNTVIDPGKLFWNPIGDLNHRANIQHLPDHNLGTVPTRLGFLSDLSELWNLYKKYGYKMHELWVRFIGDVIFKPFMLEHVDTSGQPTKFYTLWESYVKKTILKPNNNLTLSDFYCVERQRPFLIVNTSMFCDNSPGAELLPVESTAVGIGIRHTFKGKGINGADIGGGTLEPFGFNSKQGKGCDNNMIDVSPIHRFSISDIAGLSSAAFAETIEHEHPEFNGLVPRYDYWPVYKNQAPENQSQSYRFADGGNLENTGIMAQLTRNVQNIVCFVNSEMKIEPRDHNKQTFYRVDDTIPPLFGFAPMGDESYYKKYIDGGIPDKYMAFNGNRVFHYNDFYTLCEKLWYAKQNNVPVMYLQQLTTVQNPKFNIAGDLSVRVLWVYNSNVDNWWKKLSIPLRTALDVDRLQFGSFPHYGTISQLHLTAPQVNLLAELACWCVLQDECVVQDGMSSRKLFNTIYEKTC